MGKSICTNEWGWNQAQVLYINLRVKEIKILEDKKIEILLKQPKEYEERIEQKNKHDQAVSYHRNRKENDEEPSFLSIIIVLTILFLLYQLIPRIWDKL